MAQDKDEMTTNTPEMFPVEEAVENVDITGITANPANEEDELELTPAQVIELMEEAWMNEKFSPEILPHKLEIVDCILGQISFMEDNLKNLDNTNFRKGIHQLELDRLKFLITSYLRTRVMKIEMYVFHILNEEAERLSKGEDLYLSEKELDYARKYRQNLPLITYMPNSSISWLTKSTILMNIFRMPKSLYWEISISTIPLGCIILVTSMKLASSLKHSPSVDLQQNLENLVNFDPTLSLEQWKNNPIRPNMHTFVFAKSKTEIEGVVIDDVDGQGSEVVDLNRGSQMLISYQSVANLVKKGDVRLI